MKAVFLDTVGLLAVWDTADQWHAVADPVYGRLLHANTRLITTPLVLYECGNAAARRAYRDQVILLRENLGLAGDLFEPTMSEIDSAWQSDERGVSGDAGIVDLVSFAVMRRLGVFEAFTNDKHFAAAGFTVLF